VKDAQSEAEVSGNLKEPVVPAGGHCIGCLPHSGRCRIWLSMSTRT